ncbi:MAG: anti-sigma factor [Gemmatimonadaceae bacterium]
MERELSHDEAWPALGAAALDALPDEERDAVLAHAATCTTCRPELSTLRETAADLADAAPPAPMAPGQSERTRARLLARAAADRATTSRPHATADRQAKPTRWRGWLAAAAVAGLVVSTSLLLMSRARHQREVAAVHAGYMAALRRADSLSTRLADREQLVGALSGADVAVVELASTGASAPRARMFWDRATDRWTFFAHDLPAPAAGKTYQLWLITPAARISAGTFVPGGREAVVRAEYALARDSLRAVAVTEEPAGGVPQPTGPIVLVGSATR